MADFGIGEGLALAGEGAAKGAETAGAAAGADLLAPALGGGELFGAEAGLGAAEGAAAAVPGAVEGAAGLGAGVGDLAGGVGSGFDLFSGAGVGEGLPGAGVSSNLDFASLGSGGFPTAEPGPAGVGASSFAPAPGVQLPGGIAPDATSAASFNDLSFADRAFPAEEAGRTGVFSQFEIPESPVGTTGAADFSAQPAAGGGPPNTLADARPVPTQSFTQGGAAPGGGGAFDVSGNPIDPVTGSSNPQYTGGGTTPQYDPAGVGTATNAGATAPGSTNILGKVGQGALDSVTKNPLGIGLGAAGLGYSLLNANKQSDAVKAVQNQASKQSATADQLASYALNGTVPPGSQAAIDKSIAEAKANAVSNAAGQGLPTDPTKNTALAATLAKIDSQGPILAAQIAQQLLSGGASFAGLSDQLYTQLAQIDQSQRASMGKAIANFAAALNTGGGTRIQIGGTAA